MWEIGQCTEFEDNYLMMEKRDEAGEVVVVVACC